MKPIRVQAQAIEAENDIREQRFSLAEGLLNHIQDHMMLHGNKLRGALVDDIMRYSLRQYTMGWNAAIAQINTEVKAKL